MTHHALLTIIELLSLTLSVLFFTKFLQEVYKKKYVEEYVAKNSHIFFFIMTWVMLLIFSISIQYCIEFTCATNLSNGKYEVVVDTYNADGSVYNAHFKRK